MVWSCIFYSARIITKKDTGVVIGSNHFIKLVTDIWHHCHKINPFTFKRVHSNIMWYSCPTGADSVRCSIQFLRRHQTLWGRSSPTPNRWCLPVLTVTNIVSIMALLKNSNKWSYPNKSNSNPKTYEREPF